MAETKRRGRPKMTEEEKEARRLARAKEKEEKEREEKENKVNTETEIETNTETEITAETETSESTDTKVYQSYECTETCVTYITGDSFLRFYSNQQRGKNFIKRMLEEHPDECKPLMYDGKDCVQISMPPESLWYIKFPQKKRELTEEEKANARERMNKAREKRMEKFK